MNSDEVQQVLGNGPDPKVMAAFGAPIFTTDSKGKITFWSAGMRDLTGRSSSDVLGKKYWIGFSDQRIRTPVEMALATEEEYVDDGFKTVNLVTGKTAAARFRAVPILDDYDEVIGIAADLKVVEETAPADKTPPPVDLTVLTQALHKAAEDLKVGKYKTRIDDSSMGEDIKPVVKDLNGILDSILNPMEEIAEAVGRLADLNLRPRLRTSPGDDRNEIKHTLNSAIQTLHDAVASATDAVEQASSTSRQLASSVKSASGGAPDYNARLEKIIMKVKDFSAGSSRTTENAESAEKLGREIYSMAGTAAETIQSMQETMDVIAQAVTSASNIMKDIDDVVFQTNLLALNVAVEAARAGEAGKGFGVVAEEMRHIAINAKEAVSKIDEIMAESIKRSLAGQQISRDLRSDYRGISDAVGKVNSVLGTIAHDIKEQGRDTDQLHQNIEEMDKSSRRNTSSLEMAAERAKELQARLEESADMLSRFQITRFPTTSFKGVDKNGYGSGMKRLNAANQNDLPGRRKIHSPVSMPLDPEDLIPIEDESDFQDF